MDKFLKKQASIWNATRYFQKRGSNKGLWKSEEMQSCIKDVERLQLSLNTIRKHLPEKYHQLVRFTMQGTTWVIIAKDSVTASRLKMMLNQLAQIIAQDIGYKPRFKITLAPNNWERSGLPLCKVKKVNISTPTPNEAQEIIKQFINKKFN